MIPLLKASSALALIHGHPSLCRMGGGVVTATTTGRRSAASSTRLLQRTKTPFRQSPAMLALATGITGTSNARAKKTTRVITSPSGLANVSEGTTHPTLAHVHNAMALGNVHSAYHHLEALLAHECGLTLTNRITSPSGKPLQQPTSNHFRLALSLHERLVNTTTPLSRSTFTKVKSIHAFISSAPETLVSERAKQASIALYIRALGATGQLLTAASLAQPDIAKGCLSVTKAYVNVLAQNSLAQQALVVYQEHLLSKVKDVSCFNAILSGLLSEAEHHHQTTTTSGTAKSEERRGNVETLIPQLQTLIDAGRKDELALTADSYVPLIRAHALTGSITMAEATLRAMTTSGIKATVPAYNALLLAYAWHGNTGEMERIYTQRIQKECGSLGTPETLATLMHAYAKTHQVAKGVRTFYAHESRRPVEWSRSVAMQVALQDLHMANGEADLAWRQMMPGLEALSRGGSALSSIPAEFYSLYARDAVSGGKHTDYVKDRMAVVAALPSAMRAAVVKGLMQASVALPAASFVSDHLNPIISAKEGAEWVCRMCEPATWERVVGGPLAPSASFHYPWRWHACALAILGRWEECLALLQGRRLATLAGNASGNQHVVECVLKYAPDTHSAVSFARALQAASSSLLSREGTLHCDGLSVRALQCLFGQWGVPVDDSWIQGDLLALFRSS